ncbi:hypothetical protein [Cellulomonas sp.]|uniref:hypothetical protein n=1 Tax=Cellulomonas sp. TaxID=40001 RepID=UPI002D5F7056|nr:hypothetical protein [Cellulomonas sp.]HYQ75749.1 hypothetical protein [Cellulomonas sp.]
MSHDDVRRGTRTATPSVRRSRRSRTGAWESPTPPTRVVERPSRPRVLLVAALAAVIPAASRTRAPSILDHALAAGPGSRPWLAVLAFEVLVATWTVLVLARSATTLTGTAGGPPVLEVRSALRRRVTTLGHVRRVVLVTVAPRGGSTAQRALLVDGAGRVVAPPTHSRGFWLRADTRSLLRAAGVAVDWDHRRSAPGELEAAYPGASTWTDRHPVLLAVLVAFGCLAGLMTVGWLLDA